MSGINILRKLLLKEAVKGSGQASGIMSIGNNVRKLADKRLTSYLIDAQKQGVDIDGMNEQQIKYMLEMNKPKAPRVISQGDPEFKGITRNLMDALDKDLGKNVIQGKFGRPFAEELKKFRGPVKEKQDMGNFGKINVEVDYSASLDKPEFFGANAKNMYGETAATGSEFIKKERERILNTINRKNKEMVPTTHPNYKLLKKSLQDQEDALEAIKITEDLGGNENMFDFLRTKNISDYKSKPLKRSDYVKTDDPEDFADGGVAGLLGERQGFANGRRSYSASQYTGGSKKRGMSPGRSMAQFGHAGHAGKSQSQAKRHQKTGINTPSSGPGSNPNMGQTPPKKIKTTTKTPITTKTPVTTKKVITPTQKIPKSKFKKGVGNVFRTAGEINYLKNLYKLDPVGLGLSFLGNKVGNFFFPPAGAAEMTEDAGGISSTFFPKGDFLNIKETATSPTDYNIKATKDLVENLPGGVVRDVLAPAAAGAMSLPYDAIQAAQRMKPGSGVSGFTDALKAERPISSLKERFIGASGPLAERFGLEQGGRVPFAMGKRAFLKLMGSVGAGIAGLKTGVGLGGKKVATEVAKDVVTTSGPPPYFFNLVNKIKNLGDDTLASKDKTIAKKYKDYTMEEDFAGNIEIIKKGGDDMFPEDVYISYKVDEVPLRGRGKKGSTKVEEYEEFTARPDQEGKMKDVEQGVPDEVIEEGTMFEDNITDFGKADGGIARMLGE